MKQKKFEFPNGRRSSTPKEPIFISGEMTTIDAAIEKLGLKRNTFEKKRRKLIKELPRGQQLTWEHFQ